MKFNFHTFFSPLSATSTEKTVDSRWRAVNYVHGMYDEHRAQKKELQLFFSQYTMCVKKKKCNGE
jgi:hypothetical protein